MHKAQLSQLVALLVVRTKEYTSVPPAGSHPLVLREYEVSRRCISEAERVLSVESSSVDDLDFCVNMLIGVLSQ